MMMCALAVDDNRERNVVGEIGNHCQSSLLPSLHSSLRRMNQMSKETVPFLHGNSFLFSIDCRSLLFI